MITNNTVIFEPLKETVNTESTFNTPIWVENEIQKNVLDPVRACDNHKLLVSSLANADDINILDFGGSLGSGYIALRTSFPSMRFQYNIIETSAICDMGRQCHTAPEIRFSDDISINQSVDVVYVRTALQYAVDWKQTINTLISLEPSIFILEHTSTGNIRTFQTTQNYYGTKIPYWWISLSELKYCFNTSGYRCVLDAPAHPIDSSLFCSSIKSNDRISTTKNLIFKK